MSSSDNTPKDLGSTTSPLFLEKVKEVLSVLLGNRGDGNSRALTLRDLQDSGVIGTSVAAKLQATTASLSSGSSNTTTIINTDSSTTIDLTAPPTPTNFTATGAISNLIVECDTQTYTQGNGHYRSALYGATWVSGNLPVFANAVLLTEFAGKVFSYATNPSITWHLWLKWQTKDGVYSVSPAGGTNGVVVTTGANVSLMVAAMTGAGNPFTVLAVQTVIDGVTFPAGTYSTNAFIQNAQISTAKIANLAVDDAKIAALSVSKLTAGTVAAQDMISTGQSVVGGVSVPSWSINGVTGLATFNNVTVRGTVYATAGEFGGSLQAASGTFSGLLTAQAINAVDTINIAGNAVTVPISNNFGLQQSGTFANTYYAVTQAIGILYPSNVPVTTPIYISVTLPNVFERYIAYPVLSIPFGKFRVKILRFHYDNASGTLLTAITQNNRGEITITGVEPTNGLTVLSQYYGAGAQVFTYGNDSIYEMFCSRVFAVVDTTPRPANTIVQYWINIAMNQPGASAVYTDPVCYMVANSMASFLVAVKK